MSRSITTHPFDQDFRTTSEQKKQFSRDGFVKLEGFLNDSAVAMLRERADVELNRGTVVNFRAVAFSKSVYDFNAPGEGLFELMGRPYFQEALAALTGRDLFLTFEASFEIEKNVSKGAPWHVGFQSFGYQFAEQFGCTLWAPMHPIDAGGQGGGMAYVPQHVVSGQFAFATDLAVPEMLKAREQSGTTTTVQDYFDLRMGFLNSPVMTELLETHRIEDDFSPGDVFLFNKEVVHRSVMLGEGELDRRVAYVLRFVDAESGYDLNRAQTLEFPVEHYTKGLIPYKPITRRHIEIAEAGAEHGDLLAQCEYFGNRDRRMIRAQAPVGSADEAAERLEPVV